MKKFSIFSEKIITIIFLMLYSGTPIDAFLTDGFTIEDSNRAIFRLFYIFTYILSIFLLFLRWRKGLYALSKDKYTWVLMGVCALSTLWSSDIEVTIRRVFGLAGTTIFGVYFASRYTLRQQLKLCALMFGISAVMCLFFGLLLPSYGISNDINSSAWRGIYITKNVLGKRFLLSGMILLFLIMHSSRKAWFLWLGYAISFVLVLLSKSTTSLSNFVIITIAFQAYGFLRLKYERMIPTLFLIATLSASFSVWFTSEADALLSTVGKNTTLTGRTVLWPAVWDMIMKKPWLGHGYGVFWLGWKSESANVLRTVGWDTPNAHNGFLDIFLSVGLLGFLIFVVGFSIHLWRSIYLIRLNNDFTNKWLLIYLIFIIISNLTETTLLEQNSIEWILYISTTLSSKLYTNINMSSEMERENVNHK